MDRLFSQSERKSFERYLTSQSVMDYLENTANPKMAVAREKIQELFDRYVAEANSEEIKRIRGALCARDENQFFEAYFELYVFDYLKHLGFEVLIAPNLVNGAKRNSQPDFQLTEKDGSICFIEATVINKKTETFELESSKIANWLKDRFERLTNNGFDLNFHCEENELYYPKEMEIYRTEEDLYRAGKKWHEGLDHSSIRREIDDRGQSTFDDCPKFVGYLGTDPYDYLKVTIAAWPISFKNITKNSGHKIQANAGAISVSPVRGKIMSKCKQKTTQHEDVTMYLALLVPHNFKYFVQSILSDIYGVDRITGQRNYEIDLRSLICKDESVFIRKDGSFRNCNVNGILIFYDIYPWAPGYESSELYLNPILDQNITPHFSSDRIFRRIGDVMKFDRDRSEY